MSEHTRRQANSQAAAPQRAATKMQFGRDAPTETDAHGTRTWITRGANFVVALSTAKPGAVLARADDPDETMVLLAPGAGARVEAGAASAESAGDALFIVPPGASRVIATTAGVIVRIFSNAAADLCARAANAATYADGAPECAPSEPWPMPVGGYKLRHYPLEKYLEPKNFGRLFRSRKLMVNAFESTTTARDPRKLSPHSHLDFEQGSLAISGDVTHYLRTPWTADSTTWKPDEIVDLACPSLLVIPTNLIHTTRYTGAGGPNWFYDIFSPPRIDFSHNAGWVRNADEYPMEQKQ